MTRYPNTDVGEEGTADLLTDMIDDIYLKTSGTAHTSDTTLSNDPELSNIALAVGTYEVELIFIVDGPDGDVKSGWAFTGTFTGTPARACEGPGSSNTGTPSNMTHQYRNYVSYSTAVTYGLVGAGSAWNIRETFTTMVVATAGNLSIQFAQATSHANATTIQAGSRIKLRRIA